MEQVPVSVDDLFVLGLVVSSGFTAMLVGWSVAAAIRVLLRTRRRSKRP